MKTKLQNNHIIFLLAIFLLLQTAVFAVLLLPVPAFGSLREAASAVLVFEVFLLILLFVPLFLYHYFVKKSGIKDSLRAALETFLEWMIYLTP
jgi:hypothetical protein